MNLMFIALLVYGASEAGKGPITTDTAGGTMPYLYARYVLRGSYTIGSTGLRSNNPKTDTITLSGLPSGPDVVKAFLIYSVIANSPNPQMSLNGSPVSGVQVGRGPSPCWNDSLIYTYVADITPQVKTIGNGDYILSGFYCPSGTNYQPGGTDGASIVAIYCDNNLPVRTVVLYVGAFTVTWQLNMNYEDTLSWTMGNFTASNPVTTARATMLFSDGQDYWYYSQFGYSAGKEKLYFQSVLLRSGTYGLPGGEGNLYDAVDYPNAQGAISGGATSVQMTLILAPDTPNTAFEDCITIVGSILSVSSVDAETFQCVLSADEGFAGDEFGLRVAGHRITLSLPFPVAGVLSLYSSDGRLVRVLADGTLSSSEIPVPPLEPGIYFIKLTTRIGGAETKLIVRD
ncbi:MAG: T9SS type A sorting domain-containing protein [candidate division WOR-3 bacterium]